MNNKTPNISFVAGFKGWAKFFKKYAKGIRMECFRKEAEIRRSKLKFEIAT